MFGGSPFPFFFFHFCPHSVHGELGDKAEEQFELTLKFWGECNASGDVQLVVPPSAARTGWCNALGNLGSPQHHSCLGDAWTLAPEQGAEQPLSMFPWGHWFGRGAAEPLPPCFGSLRGFTPSGDGSRLLTLPPLPSCSFWFLKFLVLVGLTVGAFYIPDGSFTSGEGLQVGSGVATGFAARQGHHPALRVRVSWCHIPMANGFFSSSHHPSLVLLRRGRLLPLHPHPAHPPHRLCPLLEPAVAAQRGRGQCQGLVRRLVWLRLAPCCPRNPVLGPGTALQRCPGLCSSPLPFFLPPPALCAVTFIFYAASIVAIVLLYVYYTKPQGCTEGKVLISINLILCVIVSTMSVLPKIQVRWRGDREADGPATSPCAGMSPECPRCVCRMPSRTRGCCRPPSSPSTPSSSPGPPWPTSPVSTAHPQALCLLLGVGGVRLGTDADPTVCPPRPGL